MFWNGTRWIGERAIDAPLPPSRRRARNWLATGVMIVGIAALAIPFAATTAASSSADRLMASWSGPYGTRVFQESTALAKYAGTWSRQKGDQFLGRYAKVSTQAGAVVTFTFTGSGVSWVGPKGPNQGRARVYLDGRYLRTVDNYSRTPKPRESLFTASFAGVTRHTLKIYVLRSTTRKVVTVDALIVRGALKPAPTPSSTPSTTQLFGVSSQPIFFSLSDNTTDFDRLAAGGMSLVRFDARWDELEPTSKGSYDPAFFSRIDQIISLANQRGITLLLCFDKTPAWARGGTGTEDTPPTNRQDYADALGVLAAHYADRPGMIYEIWNEPNYVGFWTTGVNAAEYTDMLQRAYTAAKAADPDATIVAGSMNHNDPAFIAGMYAAGAHGYFDAFSLHPYTDGRAIDDTSSATFSFRPQIEGLRAALLAHGDDVPIWLTEFGYTVAPTDYKPVTEAFRAANLAMAVSYVRSYSYVRGMAAFTLNTLNSPGKGLTMHSGAVTSSWISYANAVQGK